MTTFLLGMFSVWNVFWVAPLIIIGIFAVIIVIRALAFKPKKLPEYEQTDIEVDKEKAVADLSTMIKFKTISYPEYEKEDDKEFEDFVDALPKMFPNVFGKCTFEKVERRGLLFRWKGQSDSEPSVFLAHYDVVPVDSENWSREAFSGEIIDGELWGRGTLDTKLTVNATLQTAELLISRGFVPKNDIYLAFEGNEEVSGVDAPNTVKLLQSRGVCPAIVYDEGGAVLDNVFPGVKKSCANIGIAEKGVMNCRFSTKEKGGHSSNPPPTSAIGRLSKAVTRIGKKPFACILSPATAAMFDTLGRHSGFVFKLVFANMWLFLPLLAFAGTKIGGIFNALFRTTVAFTQAQGSKAANVFPTDASVVASVRLMTGESAESAKKYLEKVIKDDKITITAELTVEASEVSPVGDNPYWQKVCKATTQTFPDAIVSPYLMTGGTDSRNYGIICDNIYRFSPMQINKELLATIHGNDERVPIEQIYKSVEFYVRLMQEC